MGGFYQGGFQVNTSPRNPDRFLFPGGLVTGRSRTGPVTQVLGGTELCHIRTDFGKDCNCRSAIDAGNCTKQRDLPFVFGVEIANDLIKLSNTMVNIRKMPLNDSNSFLLLRRHIEAADSFNHI